MTESFIYLVYNAKMVFKVAINLYTISNLIHDIFEATNYKTTRNVGNHLFYLIYKL